MRTGIEYLLPSKQETAVKELSAIFDGVAKVAAQVTDVDARVTLSVAAAVGQEKLKVAVAPEPEESAIVKKAGISFLLKSKKEQSFDDLSKIFGDIANAAKTVTNPALKSQLVVAATEGSKKLKDLKG